MAEVGVILLAGNLAALVSWRLGYPVNSGSVNVVLAVAIYAYVLWRYRKTSYARLSLRPTTWKVGLAVGAGLLLSLPPLLFFIFPVVVGHLDYSPIKNMSLAALLLRVLVEIPFSTALSEELLFRQYLFERYQTKRWPVALLRSSLIFTLWHLVVVLRTVLDTKPDPKPLANPAFLPGWFAFGLCGWHPVWLASPQNRTLLVSQPGPLAQRYAHDARNLAGLKLAVKYEVGYWAARPVDIPLLTNKKLASRCGQSRGVSC